MEGKPDEMAVDAVNLDPQNNEPASQSGRSSRSISVRKSPSDLTDSSLSRKRQRLADGEYRESSQPAGDRSPSVKKQVQQRPAPAIPVTTGKEPQILRRSPIIKPVMMADLGTPATGPTRENIVQSIEGDRACDDGNTQSLQEPGGVSERWSTISRIQ